MNNPSPQSTKRQTPRSGLRLCTPDGEPLSVAGIYQNAAAFLLCGGPSLASHDLAPLHRRGILTCAVNNAAALFRPHLWVSVDAPGNFCDAIWRDPGILKFIPFPHMSEHFRTRDPQGHLVPSQEFVGQMPAVCGFRLNGTFDPERWLYEETINWGSADRDGGTAGSRSVLYAAIRLLFHLGVRRLYLLGCDFHMQYGVPNYAFPQDRTRESVRGNNRSYRVLSRRLAILRPFFEREGYQVFNCTPGSGLTAFPHVRYEDALDSALAEMPKEIVTKGMYDEPTEGHADHGDNHA